MKSGRWRGCRCSISRRNTRRSATRCSPPSTRVCDSQRFILGPEVDALERELAAQLDVAHAIARVVGHRRDAGGADGARDRPRRRGHHADLSRSSPPPDASRGSAPRRGCVDIDPLTSTSIPRRCAPRSRRGPRPSSRSISTDRWPTWMRCSTTAARARDPGHRGRVPGDRRAATTDGRPGRSARPAASRSSPARTSAPSATPGWSTTNDAGLAHEIAAAAQPRRRAEVFPQADRRQLPARRAAGGGAAGQAAASRTLDRMRGATTPAAMPSCSRDAGLDAHGRAADRSSRGTATSSTSTSSACPTATASART